MARDVRARPLTPPEGAVAEVLLRRARLAALRADHRARRSTTRPAAERAILADALGRDRRRGGRAAARWSSSAPARPRKTRHLLDAMRDAGCLEHLRPGRHLRGDHPRDRRAAGRGVPGPRRARPGLRLRARPGADPGREGGRLIAFLGGTIGNLYPHQRAASSSPHRRPARARGPPPARHRPGQGPRPAGGRLRRRRPASPPSSTRTCCGAQPRARRRLRPRRLRARRPLRPPRAADGHPPALAGATRSSARRRSTCSSPSPRARRCGPRSRPSSSARGLEGIYAEAGLELTDWWTDPGGLYALSLARAA